ncbi:hypothetical protein HK101_011020 [Irineochytrium annulatum]|nr:hypothetical protein HK101_011020 [Irineochytrium annulatum]
MSAEEMGKRAMTLVDRITAMTLDDDDDVAPDTPPQSQSRSLPVNPSLAASSTVGSSASTGSSPSSAPSKTSGESSVQSALLHGSAYVSGALNSIYKSVIPSQAFSQSFEVMAALEVLPKEMRKECADPGLNPEILQVAKVSRDNSITPGERQFQEDRRKFCRASFAKYIGVPESEVDERDVPHIAVGGSGGGFKAMIGSTGFLKAMEEAGLYDSVMYMAGVSGSCWTLSNLYRDAVGVSPSKLADLFAKTLPKFPGDPAHIQATLAADPIARVRHIFGGMAVKRFSGLPRGVVDVYSALIELHFFSTQDGPWNRQDFKLSNQARFMAGGKAPMPIYTAIRHERPWLARKDPNAPDAMQKVDVPPAALIGLDTSAVAAAQGHAAGPAGAPGQTAGAAAQQQPGQPAPPASQPTQPLSTESPEAAAAQKNYEEHERDDLDAKNKAVELHTAWWQWFELTPVEVGCDELRVWIPSWSFGRKFYGGKSIDKVPEQSFTMQVGMVASAMTAPFQTSCETLERTDPKSWIGNKLRDRAVKMLSPGSSIRVKELLASHPFHSAYNWNPLFKITPGPHPPGLINSERIQLIDAGADNNQPLIPFIRPGRGVDVIFVLDSSEDVERNVTTNDLSIFAERRKLKLTRTTPEPPPQQTAPPPGAMPKPPVPYNIRYANRYCQVFQAEHLCKNGEPAEHGAPAAEKDFAIVYLPMLGNQAMPDFSPSDFSFGKLQYTDKEVQDLIRCAGYNYRQDEETIKRTLREAWQKKRDARLAAQRA